MMSDRSLSSFGFSEPKRNYFPVPNEWFEYVDNLPHGALFVLLYLMKHTWGHHESRIILGRNGAERLAKTPAGCCWSGTPT